MTLISEIRNFIIMPTLKACDLWSDEAEILLTGTLMMESGAEAIIQSHGPALGMFQIEPVTHQSIRDYLYHQEEKSKLLHTILNVCNFSYFPTNNELISNIKYSCIIARLIYYRHPDPIPSQEDREGLAMMYKKIYNTERGKADVSKAIEIFKSISSNLP